ncbi:TPA: hypothetical protein DEG21_03330 [Patescibacteria group bacterium]|nr:hypothetical protein [Candidatus Gracilibacteria bacterium]HBY74891.1 hypothetical protein [Candidatus Gracilibacteria bacterium]
MARQYVLKTKYSKFPEKDKITLESRMKSFYKGCFDDINAYVENTKTSVNTSALEYNLNTDRVKTKKENQKSAYAKKYC